jgi:xanthine dehydrogenase accessory factor
MHDWIDTLIDLRCRGNVAVLVTVASVKGSAPRAAGTKMVVTADEVHGTIGGGHLEFTAIDIARKQLDDGESPQLQRFPLGASLGQCCGGVVNLLFEPIAPDAAWVETLSALRTKGEEFVIVTPVHGAPYGGKLFVSAGDTQGALGAAQRDAAAAKIARDLIASNRRARLVTVADAESAEITTGVPFFFDPVFPADFNIVLFGAGHVGRALVNILGVIPCRVTWVDSRDDAFPPEVPGNVEVIATDAPDAEVDVAAPGSYFLVMTHSHALDEQLSERILRRADFAYFGLIGSVSKRRQFERRLAARGIAAESLAAMICPIGVGGIAGKEPGVIAVAVAAQLLQRQADIRAGALVPERSNTINAGAMSVIVVTGE